MHAQHLWACYRLCDRLSPLVSVPIPRVMSGQAVANYCNAGVCCAHDEQSIPNVHNRQHIRGFGLPRQFTPCRLRMWTATWGRCWRALSPWISKKSKRKVQGVPQSQTAALPSHFSTFSKFPPMRLANGPPLDVKLG